MRSHLYVSIYQTGFKFIYIFWLYNLFILALIEKSDNIILVDDFNYKEVN